MTASRLPDLVSGKLVPQGKAAFSGIDAEILLGGEYAPMTVMLMTVAAEQGAPAHVSMEEDKVFCISDGRLLFLVNTEKFEVSAGDRVFVGRGVIHGFSALVRSAQMTLISTPARHDRFFQTMGALPSPHDLKDVQVVCERFGQLIVVPLVTP